MSDNYPSLSGTLYRGGEVAAQIHNAELRVIEPAQDRHGRWEVFVSQGVFVFVNPEWPTLMIGNGPPW